MGETIERWQADVEFEERMSIAKAVAIDHIRKMKAYKIGNNRIPTVKLEDVISEIERMGTE